MLEGDGGHIKELYRRGQAHEQLGTDRLGLTMKDYTGCSTCGTRAEDKAGSICRLHQPSSTAARAHQRAWPWTCSSSASMRFPWSRTFSFLPKHLHAFSKQLRIARASSARGHSLFARRTRRAHATAAACTPSSSRGSTSPPRVAPRPPAPPSTRPRGAPYATHRCPPSPPSASRDIAPMAPVPVCGAPRARPASRARAKLL